MSVPLIEQSGGAAVSDSGSTEQHFSPTATASTSSGSADRRDLVTVHVGEGMTLAQEDLELLLVVTQTLILLAWLYVEVIDS